MKNRAEHLAWAKVRALEYVEIGELDNAFRSMCSDLNKHEDTAGHAGLELGAMLHFGQQLGTAADMRNWIEGFR